MGEVEPLQRQARALLVILNGMFKGRDFSNQGDIFKAFEKVKNVIRCAILKDNYRFEPLISVWAVSHTPSPPASSITYISLDKIILFPLHLLPTWTTSLYCLFST